LSIFQFSAKRPGLRLAALLALAALPALLTACGSSGPEPTPTTSFGPISFPYVFEGNFTVAGQPGPVGVKMFTMLNGQQSGSVNETVREGQYRNVLAGANKPEDIGKTITFHIGDPDGEHVQAEQTVPFHATGELQRVQLDLTFPELP
jgi:hypothetical protein